MFLDTGHRIAARGRWLWWCGCCGLWVLVVAAGWLQSKHARGREVLDRMMAESGIKAGPGLRPRDGAAGAPIDPRLLQAAGLAHSMGTLKSYVPPVLVRVGLGEALPGSDLDWWISDWPYRSNSWSGLKREVERCGPQLDRILGLVDGRIQSDSGRMDFVLGRSRREYIEGLCHVLRGLAMVGMRERRVEPVVAALRALEVLGESPLGWFEGAYLNYFQAEAESIRLAATLVREPSEAWLAAIAPSPRRHSLLAAYCDQERMSLERQVSELRYLPNHELAPTVSALWMRSGQAVFRAAPEFARDHLIQVLQGLAESVAFPVWRYGWGDLAIAEWIRDHEHRMNSLRSAMESCGWRNYAKNQRKAQAQVGPETYLFLCYRVFFEQKVRSEFLHQTEVGLNAVRIALLRHRLRHGGYPESLTELVPTYLEAVPVDWMDGKPLRYQTQAGGGFRIRSCGVDGKDDGGRIRGSYTSEFPDDRRGARPWIEEGNDLVWPTRGSDLHRDEFMKAMGLRHAWRLREIAWGNPYRMDPELMRRYGLLPKASKPRTNSPTAVSAGNAPQETRLNPGEAAPPPAIPPQNTPPLPSGSVVTPSPLPL